MSDGDESYRTHSSDQEQGTSQAEETTEPVYHAQPEPSTIVRTTTAILSVFDQHEHTAKNASIAAQVLRRVLDAITELLELDNVMLKLFKFNIMQMIQVGDLQQAQATRELRLDILNAVVSALYSHEWEQAIVHGKLQHLVRRVEDRRTLAQIRKGIRAAVRRMDAIVEADAAGDDIKDLFATLEPDVPVAIAQDEPPRKQQKMDQTSRPAVKQRVTPARDDRKAQNMQPARASMSRPLMPPPPGGFNIHGTVPPPWSDEESLALLQLYDRMDFRRVSVPQRVKAHKAWLRDNIPALESIRDWNAMLRQKAHLDEQGISMNDLEAKIVENTGDQEVIEVSSDKVEEEDDPAAGEDLPDDEKKHQSKYAGLDFGNSVLGKKRKK